MTGARRSVVAGLALALGLAGQAIAADDAQRLLVAWREGRLSVDAVEAPLRDVLANVARRTGLAVRGDEALDGAATVRFRDRSLRDALERLLASYDYLLVEEVGNDGGVRPVRLVIVGRRVEPLAPAPSLAGPDRLDVASADSASSTADPYRQVEQLAEAGNRKALAEAAATGESASRALALQRLAQQDPGEALRIALETARSRDATERLFALQVLGGLDSAEAANALSVALADPAAEVRQAAVLALMGQSFPVPQELLDRARRDESEAVRLLAEKLAARSGGQPLAATAN